MSEKLVSIIIPIYNVEAYIKRCLMSVVNQKYKNIEIILVDDCGSDNSMNYALSYIDTLSDINYKVIRHSANRGLSSARNSGIDVCAGEYIFFLDSDDDLPYEAIDLLIHRIEIDQSEIAIGGMNWIYPNCSKLYIGKKTHVIGNNNILSYSVKHSFPLMGCNKLIKKDFLINNALYFKENIYHEDLLWSFFLLSKLTSLSVVDSNTYNYYIRPNSITTNALTFQKKRSFQVIVDEMLKVNMENKYIKSIFRSRIYSMLEIVVEKGNKDDLFEYRNFVTERVKRKELFSNLISFRDLLKIIPVYLPAFLVKYYVLWVRNIRQ